MIVPLLLGGFVVLLAVCERLAEAAEAVTFSDERSYLDALAVVGEAGNREDRGPAAALNEASAGRLATSPSFVSDRGWGVATSSSAPGPARSSGSRAATTAQCGTATGARPGACLPTGGRAPALSPCPPRRPRS